MDLDRFFDETGWTEEQLAVAARADQSTVNRLRKGSRKASLSLALRLEDASGGRVTAEEIPMTRQTRQALRAVRGRERANATQAGAATDATGDAA